MLKNRNRLLIALVLVLAATATAWTVAGARTRADDGSSSGTVTAPGIPKPAAMPAAGEPDQPKAQVPPSSLVPQNAVAQPASGEGEVGIVDPAGVLIRWISRIWAMWHMGVAF